MNSNFILIIHMVADDMATGNDLICEQTMCTLYMNLYVSESLEKTPTPISRTFITRHCLMEVCIK